VPQIIVLADAAREQGEEAVMLRERVSPADMKSDHFATHLVERLGWAVGDAHEVERDSVLERDPVLERDSVANGSRRAS
jgi:hypothetical protein